MGTKSLKGIRAIGFDVDGTLYKLPLEADKEIGKEIIRAGAELLGKSQEEFASEYYVRRKEFAGNTLTLKSFGLDGEKIFQDLWDKFPIENYVERDTRLINIMNDLHKQYRLFILSNGTGRQIARKLKIIGLDESLFELNIACYDRGWVKPDPAPFLFALEQLKMKPEEVVYVGDRTDVDIEGAQAVGMKAVLVGREDKKADASCGSIYEIANCF